MYYATKKLEQRIIHQIIFIYNKHMNRFNKKTQVDQTDEYEL